MATPQRDLKVQFLGDANSLIRAADKAQRALDDTETSAKKADKGLDILKKGALALGGAFALSKVADFVGDSLNLAVAAEEAGNKFDAVFGPAAADLRDTLDALGDKAGIADFKLQDISATTGNVILGLGGTTKEASDLVDQMAPLAVDLASFNGAVGDSPAVLAAMTSALTGEREALKTYGVVIKEADVQQRALQMSGKDAASELTNLEKAAATAELIMEGAGAAVGDMDRNLTSAATQQAQLNAEWQEAQAQLGAELLPAMQQFVGLLRDAIPLLSGVASTVGDVAEGVGAFVEGLTSNRSWVDVIELNTVLEETARLAGESTDTVHTAGTALATLAKRGELSAAAMDAVQEATGATAEEMRAAAERAGEYAKEVGFSEDAIRDLDEATGFYTGVLDRQGDVMGDAKDEASFWARTMDTKATPAAEDLAEATDEATTATYNLITAQREAVDPAFRAMRAARDYAEAQEATNEAVAKYGDASPEAIKAAEDQALAFLDAKEAAKELSKGGYDDNREALRKLYEEMGLADEVIAALLAEFDKINDFQFSKKFITIETKGGGGITLPPGVIGAAQHGGFAKRGGLTLVGEEGPEIVDLPTGAAVYPNGSVPAGVGGGASVTINVNGFVGSEQQLAAEIDRLLTRRSRVAKLGFS